MDGLPVLLAFLEAISTCIHEANILGTKPYGDLDTEEDVFKNELLLSRGSLEWLGRWSIRDGSCLTTG